MDVLNRIIEKIMKLEHGQEYYHHYDKALPSQRALAEIVNAVDPEIDFIVIETINGYRFIRTR